MSKLAASISVPRGTGLWKDYTGPGAKTLEITYETSRLKELWLEEAAGSHQLGKLSIDGNNAEARVGPGEYHLLFRGKTSRPKEEYDIEITGPKEAKWKPKPAMKSDSHNNIASVKTFTIDK